MRALEGEGCGDPARMRSKRLSAKVRRDVGRGGQEAEGLVSADLE